MYYGRTNGHSGISNEKRKDGPGGDFECAMSYLVLDDNTAKFVIHVYSNRYTPSDYLQRSDIVPNGRKNFLERLGFEKFNSCNILGARKCYYKEIEVVNRNRDPISSFGRREGIQLVYDRFDMFANGLSDLYQAMEKIDQKLYNMGYEIPWTNLMFPPIVIDEKEKVYPPGYEYEIYKDLNEVISQAKKRVLIIDGYPDEDVINLHVSKVPESVPINILVGTATNQAKTNFLKVAQKFSQNKKRVFEVRENSLVHDRFFFIDGRCFTIGASLKDAGVRKPTYMIEVNSAALFTSTFEPLWNNGHKIV